MKIPAFNVIAIALSSLAVAFSAVALFKIDQLQDSTKSICYDEQILTKLLLDRVRACILNSKEINKKDEIITLLDSLDNDGCVAELGNDDLRTKYVHTQGSIEHVLACAMVLGELDNLVGVIHTPQPATPLCTKVDNLDSQLLDETIRFDLEKLLTVRTRAVVVREYLELGGKLFIAYPKGGLEKRTIQQQEIYKQELAKYADSLFDAVLSCTDMEPSMVGATYFFKGTHGEVYAFSIKSQQANSPTEQSEWGMWLGKIEDPIINQRVYEILNYLEANNGPDLRSALASNH